MRLLEEQRFVLAPQGDRAVHSVDREQRHLNRGQKKTNEVWSVDLEWLKLIR